MGLGKILTTGLALVVWNEPLPAQPVIIQQPASQTAIFGSNITFSVLATGTGPFTYQWRLNGTNLPNNIITTVAGNGTNGYSGDGGPATKAMMGQPNFVTLDAAGNLFFSDFTKRCVRKVDTNGIISTVAGGGTGTNGFGDGGAATNAVLGLNLGGVAFDAVGSLYIADRNDYVVRKVDTNGIITRFAGNGTFGYSGDGQMATNASFGNNINGIALDAHGNMFIGDTYSSRIRKVDTNGVITTCVGNGTNGYSGDGGLATNAKVWAPNGITVDSDGNLIFADWGGPNAYFGYKSNNTIRKIDTNGIIITIAGKATNGYSGDGGFATNALLSGPRDVTKDNAGNIYIADFGNNRIRKLDTNGIITTVVGNGGFSYSGDGGAATNASLNGPTSVKVDAAGNLFISDYGHYCIRKVAFAGLPTLTLQNITTTNVSNYQVIVTSASGSVTSSVATINLQLPPVTSAFTASNKLCNFNWSAVTSQTYMLQYATNLAAPNWMDLGNPITATGNVAATADAPSGTGQRFYRIRLWP
jgi:NHL repeat